MSTLLGDTIAGLEPVSVKRHCQIDCGPASARLWGPEAACLLAAEILAFENPKARFLRYRTDGKIRLMRRPSNAFPAGLAGRLVRGLRAAGYTVTLNDAPQKLNPPLADRLEPDPPGQDPTKRRFDTLAPHQEAAVEHALRVRRCALQLPTSAGKTAIGAEIIRRTGYPTLWMTSGDKLIDDTITALKRRLPGVEIGKVGAGKKEWGQIVVASVKTLAGFHNMEPFWSQFDLLIIDEAHHVQATTWIEVASKVRAATRIGLSGTVTIRKPDPIREARIEGMTGPTFEVIDHEALTEIGFIAKPRVVFLRPDNAGYPDYTEIRDEVWPRWRENPQALTTLGTRLYGLTYRRGIIENRHRNLMILQTAQGHALANDKVVVLLTQIAHAQWLAEMLGKHTGGGRIQVRALNGQDKPEVRDAILDELRACQTGFVLFATPFFREGLDIPEIDVLVLGGAGKSEIAVLQSIGRALRPRPDKGDCLIYDMLDGRQPFGGKGDYLFEHFCDRLELYKAKKFSITMPYGVSA